MLQGIDRYKFRLIPFKTISMMIARILRIGLLMITLSLLGLSTQAQEKKTNFCTIRGKVKCDKGDEPLFGIVAAIIDLNKWVLTSDNGSFTIEKLPAGKVTVSFRRLGLKEVNIDLDLKAGETRELNVLVPYLSLMVEEVVITAKENPNKLSSTSLIGTQAIEHIQASSLGDIMQLLPGQIASNPDLNQTNQATLRSTSSDNDESQVSAQGTAIIMDGSPLSNNANLQVTNTSEIGSAGYFSTVSGGGIDLRQIPADNIESVEVIRGIPSVKHGDLTSGAVIVTTKAGVTPYSAKVKVNPTTQQFYIGKGVKLSKNRGSINFDLDFANSRSDLRTASPKYTRWNGQLTHSTFLLKNRMLITSKLSASRTLDVDKDKDGATLESRYSEDLGLRFSNTSKLQLKGDFADCINTNIAVDFSKQTSYTRSLFSGSITPLADQMEDGTYQTIYLPSEYYTGLYIDGKPFNLYLSADGRLHKTLLGLTHRIMYGVDWKTDANFGKGKYFDNNYYIASGQRARSFKDIPALNQLSYYLEDKFSVDIAKRSLKVQAGLRYDIIQPETPTYGAFGQSLQPRVNFSYDMLKMLSIKGGYGKTSKSPSLIFLYPDLAYMDAVSFNQYSGTYPNESLAEVTTKVFSTANKNMNPSMMTKMEFGFDVNYKKNVLSFTMYKENLEGGYGFKDVFAAVKYPVYEIYSYIPGGGLQPKLDMLNVDTAILRDTYKVPVNTIGIKRVGFEFTYDSPKIPGLGTQFNFSGAWTFSERTDSHNDIYINSQYFPRNTDKLIGVYGSNGSKTQQLVTTLRVIQHIPQFRFIASLSVQAGWIDRRGTTNINEYPFGFYDKAGAYFPLTIQESHSESYSFLVKNYDNTYYMESITPSFFQSSLKLTKELNNDMSFSFYANNMFMNNPAFCNDKTGNVTKLNEELFFGAELNFKF